MAPNWTKSTIPFLFVTLVTAGGCGGRQDMPMSYGYGDMFSDDSDEGAPPPRASHRSSGGGSGRAEADSVEIETASLSQGPSRRERRRGPPPPHPPPAPAPAPAPEPAPALGASDMAGEAVAEGAPAAQMEPLEEPAPSDVTGMPQQPTPAPPQTSEQASSSETPSSGGADGEPEAIEVDHEREEREAPLMIYEAGLTLAVNDITEGVDAVAEFASETGGYVVRQDDDSIVIRVPAEGFREALGRLEALGDVIDRSISAQDVSDTVRDLRIRLQNAEQMRDRLMELLEEAETVQESLVIERELERLNETIELLRGALNSLGERIAFSTITVDFQPVQTQQEVPNQLFRLPFGWLDELGLANLLRL